MDEPFSITLNPGIKPIQAAPHRYADPKLSIIKEALDKLVNTEQLIRVNKPTPWISNMVVRERPASDSKPAKVRICLDPSQTINKAIIRPVYPIPTLEENIHRFHRAKIFSTFDIKDAFQTIRLTDESSFLTTMHTPWGRYCWTRLPFGISSAPEEFQHRLHDILCGIEGVVNIPDILSRHHCPRDPMRLPSACATSAPFRAISVSRIFLSGEKGDYIWKFLGGFFVSKVLKRHDKYQKTWLCQGNPARWT